MYVYATDIDSMNKKVKRITCVAELYFKINMPKYFGKISCLSEILDVTNPKKTIHSHWGQQSYFYITVKMKVSTAMWKKICQVSQFGSISCYICF